MKLLKDIFRGIAFCFRGFSILFEKGFWPYMFYPLILWVILWLASFCGIFILADGLSAGLKDYFSFQSVPENGHWLSWARPFLMNNVGILVSWVLKILFWMMGSTFVKYFLLIALSPVFAALSEKTEEKYRGMNSRFRFSHWLKDMLRGTMISFRNMLIEYFFIFLCFLGCLFFPPLFFITTPFLFLAGWYFAGFSLMDYSCERHRFSVHDSIGFMKTNRGCVIGVGMVYSFFLALPFVTGQLIGIMLGPAVAAIGATIGFLELTNSATTRQS